MTRTPMARVPRLFRTRSRVPWKKIAADIILFGIIVIFSFYIGKDILCT